MKTLVIDNKHQKVFVLDESDTRLVYIPVKALDLIDYQRLLEIEKEVPTNGSMLATMRKRKLSNGRNSLDLYDNLIQIMDKNDDESGERLRKPNEPKKKEENPDVITVTQKTSEKGGEPLSSKEVYEYTDKEGKTAHWSGTGRKPDPIAKFLKEGGNLEDLKRTLTVTK